jgi:4-hydroxybenzoate polyprenyltransferase
MLYFFRLIRIPNLVIVAVTQGILYFHILLPQFTKEGIQPILPFQQFLLFILVTLLVTAGGYIINDILDYETDMINKADSVIVKNRISLQSSTWLYFSFSALGFLLAIYLAFYIRKPELVILFPVAVGSLFVYSKYLKKMALVGNLIISSFAAGVAGIIGFAEMEGLMELGELAPGIYVKILILFWAYMLFAFYSTLYREIVKDIEDIEGDAKQNFRTLPVLLGIKKVKKISFFFGISLLVMMLMGAWFAWPVLNLIGRVVVLPILLATGIWSLIKLNRAEKKSDFYIVSQLIKVVMLAGVLMLLCIKIN